MSHVIPQVSAIPVFTPPEITRERLGNGLDVLVAARRGLPVFDVELIARGGGMVDSPALAGRASMTAEMLDEGTDRRNALDISTTVESLGAELDLRAGWDACFFSLHGLVPQFDAILDLLTEVALQPTFPGSEFKRKSEERLFALIQERDEPRIVALKSLASAVFGRTHPYGRPLAGTVASIQQLDRVHVAEYYAGYFSPSAAHLIVVGDLDADTVISALADRFGGWSADQVTIPPLPELTAVPRRIYLIDRPGAAQSEVRAGHVGVARGTADYFALIVLNTILGGSFRSRLNMKLREEKGFTYGANSSFSFRRQGGAFSAGSAVFTGATAETMAIITNEIERIRRDPVTADELTRARNFLSIGFMRNFETTADIAGHLAELALYDLPLMRLREYPERVQSVTAEDVLRAARAHLDPEHLAIVVVGDRALVEPELQALELGEVVALEAE